MNVEAKLGKALGKDSGKLVVKAADRDTVLNEISARMARYEKIDTDMYDELKALRADVKDVFNKGLKPGDEMMEQLYFLDPKTSEFVEKLTRSYETVVTPDDFAQIASIMSENLRSQVPILKEFTRFFGRLAEDYVINAKPSEADFDWKAIAKTSVLGKKGGQTFLPKRIAEILGLNPKESVNEKILQRFDWWKPNSTFSDLLYGVASPKNRRTGTTIGKLEIAQVIKLNETEILYPNKLPKSWSNIPWINFDGKTVEQNFTQVFEERLRYKDADGKWITNILQVPQKTDPSWWEEVINKSGKINDIVDAQKARTAYAVNGNHSNDAVLVKRFHIWGSENGVPTSTVHDAFFTNVADMLKSRMALRNIYATAASKNTIRDTLDEMRARGLPDDLYFKYLNEAIDIGLIPVVGRSRINGRIMTDADILLPADIIQDVSDDFKKNYGWYGIG